MIYQHQGRCVFFTFVAGFTLLSLRPLAFAAEGGESVSNAPSGRTIPFTEWIDSVWCDHMQARVGGITEEQPVVAEAFYRDALRVDPSAIVLVERLALFYREAELSPLDVMLASYGRLLDEARPAWTNMPAAAPAERAEVAEDTSVYAEAKHLFDDKNFIEAEILLRNRLAAAPHDLQALTDLGMLYSHTRDWGMAAAAFAYARALFPQHFASANNLCVALDQIERPREVLHVIRSLLEKDPANPSLLEHAARYSLATGATNDAIALARRWCEAAPTDPKAEHFLSTLEGGKP